VLKLEKHNNQEGEEKEEKKSPKKEVVWLYSFHLRSELPCEKGETINGGFQHRKGKPEQREGGRKKSMSKKRRRGGD